MHVGGLTCSTFDLNRLSLVLASPASQAGQEATVQMSKDGEFFSVNNPNIW